MPEILLYNIEPKKSAGIKLLCSTFAIGYREIDPADFGRPIGALLGLSDSSGIQPDAAFDEELLYFVDIDGGLLDILLFQLRKRKLTVPLKAVKTDTNITFTSWELYRELSAEREAIRKGMTAHNESSGG